MAWGKSNVVRKIAPVVDTSWTPPQIQPAIVDWERLVVVDLETYYDDTYTLKKLSTSEYVRDPRFKAQMVGIKIGSKPTKWYPAGKIAAALRSIPWATHSFLGHHSQFDGLILWEKYGISPLRIYDTLSMARALYSNDIGAGLDEVSIFTGGEGKIKDVLDKTKGVLNWSKQLNEEVGPYCVRDVDETLRIFKHMLPAFPAEEIELIDRICRMFTEPVLGVDRPRVEKELAREIEEKKQILLSFAKDADAAGIKLELKDLRELAEDEGIAMPNVDKKFLKDALLQILPAEAVAVKRVKKLIGSSEKFANLLRACGVEPPLKISKAWIDKPKNERTDEGKYGYAFARTDLAFVELQEHEDPKVRTLAEARISVKSTTNETKAARFLKASENGAKLPVYLKYSAAHTHRLGGGNKMNLQAVKRGGELRRSILAPDGHVLAVVDSGQIEPRMNAWLWGQEDLLEDFRLADSGKDRDVYCKFGDSIYHRVITKADEEERFITKTAVISLGYGTGHMKFKTTLALGINGPQVFLEESESQRIVQTYRKKFYRIKNGWNICERIIEDMIHGREGSYKCIAWGKETIYLPNGMSMHYPNIRDARVAKAVAQKLTGEIDPDFDPDRPEYVYDMKGAEKKIYGAALDENLCQALCRIVVMGQSLKIAQKYRWVTSTHDEGVFLAKKAHGQKALDYALAEFRTPPVWAPDLPLNADGGFDVFYCK